METTDHRAQAAECFNRCWELLETEGRTEDEDEELLVTACASLHHWVRAGGAQQVIISEWMVARAAAAIGLGDLSLRFAVRAHRSATEGAGLPDWLTASTAEGMARAYAASGDAARCDEWRATATRLVRSIADPEDRDLIASQLATVPAPTPPEPTGAYPA